MRARDGFTRALVGAALAALLSLTALQGCGRRGGSTTSGSGPPAPALFGGYAVAGSHTLSGLPSGIRLEWQRIDDPAVVGYFVYRDTQPIPDSARGDLELRRNNDQPVPQPETGATVVFDDTEFPPPGPEVGTTYHYRISTLDDQGREGPLSNEITITVSPQVVTGISPESALCGAEVTISGDFFGIFNPDTDQVLFTDPTTGGNDLAAEIVDWQDESIITRVPPGAAPGPIGVLIASTMALSDTNFSPQSPFLSGTEAGANQPGDLLRVLGGNLLPNDNLMLSISPGIEITPDDPAIGSWAGSWIEVFLPEGIDGDGLVTVLDGSNPDCPQSNTVSFLVRPVLSSLSSELIFPGETITITGERLGTSRGIRKVIVGGIEATTYPTWSDTSVSFVVPDDIPLSGEIVVDNGGVVSNPLSYTLDVPLTMEVSGVSDGDILRDPVTLDYTFSGHPDFLVFRMDGEIVDQVSLLGEEGSGQFVLDPQQFLNRGYQLEVLAVRRGLEVGLRAQVWLNIFPGDFNADDRVDQQDLDLLLSLLDTQSTDPGYSPLIDFNSDGVIDERDGAAVAVNFGKTRGEGGG